MSSKREAALRESGKLVPGSTFAAGAVARARWRWKPAVPAVVRELLIARSGGWCEAQLPMCLGGATDSAHRITQKSGGRHGAAKAAHDVLSNTLDLCRACHRWTHDYPALAKNLGLALDESDNPLECPVAYRGEVRYLTDGGAVADNPPSERAS
jgi:hypothetical protein